MSVQQDGTNQNQRTLIPNEFLSVMIKLSSELAAQRHSFDDNQRELFKNSIIEASQLLFNYPQIFYKMLVLLDQSNIIGSIALTYNYNIEIALSTKDINRILETLVAPWFESESKIMNPVYRRAFDKHLKELQITFNLLIDKESMKIKSKGVIDDSKLLGAESYKKCQEDICLIDEEDDNIPQGTIENVWVPSIEDNGSISKHCFVLRDLLMYIYRGMDNPYTRKAFSRRIVAFIQASYAPQLDVVHVFNIENNLNMPIAIAGSADEKREEHMKKHDFIALAEGEKLPEKLKPATEPLFTPGRLPSSHLQNGGGPPHQLLPAPSFTQSGNRVPTHSDGTQTSNHQQGHSDSTTHSVGIQNNLDNVDRVDRVDSVSIEKNLISEISGQSNGGSSQEGRQEGSNTTQGPIIQIGGGLSATSVPQFQSGQSNQRKSMIPLPQAPGRGSPPRAMPQAVSAYNRNPEGYGQIQRHDDSAMSMGSMQNMGSMQGNQSLPLPQTPFRSQVMGGSVQGESPSPSSSSSPPGYQTSYEGFYNGSQPGQMKSTQFQ